MISLYIEYMTTMNSPKISQCCGYLLAEVIYCPGRSRGSCCWMPHWPCVKVIRRRADPFPETKRRSGSVMIFFSSYVLFWVQHVWVFDIFNVIVIHGYWLTEPSARGEFSCVLRLATLHRWGHQSIEWEARRRGGFELDESPKNAHRKTWFWEVPVSWVLMT